MINSSTDYISPNTSSISPLTIFLIIILTLALAFFICLYLMERRKRSLLEALDTKNRVINHRLEHIINTASVMFLTAIDDTIVEINENMKLNTSLSVGERLFKIFTDQNDYNRLSFRIKHENSINNEVVKLNFSDTTAHRCLLSLATANYDGINALVLWAVDIEQTELRSDHLRAARRTLQTILDTLPYPVRITDIESTSIIYVNNACVKLFGYPSADSMCGRSIRDIIPPTQSDGADSFARIDRFVKSESSSSMDFEYLSAHGEIIETRIMTCTIDFRGRKSTLVITGDLSKEREAQRMRQNLQTILDMLPVAIRIADNNTKVITYINKAASEMIGSVSPEVVYGMSYYAFLPEYQPGGITSVELMETTVLTAEPITSEITLRRINGELFDALVTSCLIYYNGVESSLGIVRDLTEEKRYQSLLTDAVVKEKEASQLKSRFLVNMSHEIRTPMNAIIGLTEIELNKEKPGEFDDVFKKINTSAKNLLSIINDILDLSKIEAEKIELFEDIFELEEVLGSALLVASPRLEGKNVEFILNQELQLPRFLIGDRTRLWQILKNFLDNSAKFTEMGKIVLSVFSDPLRSDNETIFIKFIVEDTGIGMGEDQIKRVFMPYEQIYNNAQRKYTGTGLGMAISKQLCELMNGSLLLESKLGYGTTVSLSIPFKRSHDNEPVPLKDDLLKNLNVLVVDDDLLSLDVMRRLLENSGAKCTLSQNGMDAMEIIIANRDSNVYFDLILLDYLMDGLNGLETARQIQTTLSNAPKVLMVTAYQKMLIKSELDDSGIEDVLEKPFLPTQFIRKICSVFDIDSGLKQEHHEVLSRFKDTHVLLCEDYRLNQEVAVGMLAQLGITAEIAENGSICLELLNSGNCYDLILMDLQMPVMDGYEATRIIRADSRFDSIPIVSLSADAMREEVERCLALGMNDHIAKPIEFKRLSDALHKWLPVEKRSTDTAVATTVNSSDPNREALERFGGDREQYERALFEFSKSLPDSWQSFSKAMDDPDELKRYVHKLKGASGTLAENDIYKSAIAFESTLRSGTPDEKLYNHLAEVSLITKRRILSQTPLKEDARPRIPGTAEEFAPLLRSLKDALDEYDPIASSEVIDLLKAKLWKPSDEAALRLVYENVERYEFAIAQDILAGIMN